MSLLRVYGQRTRFFCSKVGVNIMPECMFLQVIPSEQFFLFAVTFGEIHHSLPSIFRRLSLGKDVLRLKVECDRV